MARPNETTGFKACLWLLGVLILVVSIVLLATSIKKLEATEQAIMYDTVEKRTLDRKTQGLYAGPPFFQFVSFGNMFSAVNLDVPCLTLDGLPVNLSITFQYMPDPATLLETTLDFRDAGKYESVVEIAAGAAVLDACALFNISQYQGERPVIQAAIDDKIRGNLAALRGRALAAQLVNVGVPESWKEATSDKQKAQQDIDFALNERQQQLAQANNTIMLALQDARIINQTAATNVSITLTTAQQNAAAVTAEYEAFGAVLVDMVEQYKLDPAGLVKMLQNNLVANSKDVDLVLPAAV